ncbi:MAG: Nudix family hydrolase [Wenzhouxiangella sp.]|nr:Nudix family hydrolase [Wenzhouxiangella sp.]
MDDAAAIRPDLVPVVAGVLRDSRGRVLLAQRLPGKHLAGTWEFPGGKCEPGESPHQALARELAEELDIQVESSAPLLTLTHRYPEKSVRLMLREVPAWRGEPRGHEGQPLRWVTCAAMTELPMPAADRPICRILDLDPRYAISPDPTEVGIDGVVNAWQDSLAAGFRLLQLRAPTMPSDQLLVLARRLGRMAREQGARWLLNGAVETAVASGADGVHLSSRALAEFGERRRPEALLLAASCHDARELDLAAAVGADYVCLSPVQGTVSHPQARPLGWSGFADLCAHSSLPALALGGVTPAQLSQAREHGAWGVAGISAFGGR